MNQNVISTAKGFHVTHFLLSTIVLLLCSGLTYYLINETHHSVLRTNEIMLELSKMNEKLDKYLEHKQIRETKVDGHLATNRERIKETWELTRQIKTNKCIQSCIRYNHPNVIINQNQTNAPISNTSQSSKMMELNIGKNAKK